MVTIGEMGETSVRRLAAADAPRCGEILSALPGWFGFEEVNVAYVAFLATAEGYVAELDGRVAGFVGLKHHFPEASEIHVLAVEPALHRRGIGRALLAEAERLLRSRGVRLLQVKTLGPSRQDEGYARTRAFYAAVGFIPLEEMRTLWNEDNPALVMVKQLR